MPKNTKKQTTIYNTIATRIVARASEAGHINVLPRKEIVAILRRQMMAETHCAWGTARAHIVAILDGKTIGDNWGSKGHSPDANPGGRPRSPYPLQRINVRCTREEAERIKAKIADLLAADRKEQ